MAVRRNWSWGKYCEAGLTKTWVKPLFRAIIDHRCALIAQMAILNFLARL